MTSPVSFLRRWSERKLQQQSQTAPALAPARADVPALETLGFEADFSPFLQAEVDPELRRAALRKLFMTDHYRVMDGLDVYVDDYSRPVPLPAEMLMALDHAQTLLTREETPLEAAVDTNPPESEQSA